MENSKILIVFNPKTHSKEGIKAELIAEKYKHHFSFHFESEVLYQNKVIEHADEVWFFGKCEELPVYKIIKSLGKDCWQMG